MTEKSKEIRKEEMTQQHPLKDWRFVVRCGSLGIIAASVVIWVKYYR